ncbi:glycosyltransferase [Hymenobacter sp. BT491]|uniref:glycosyltransferase n=1 Tax=Hymenobacter sp. BT491 TaxID=2766779 RepID=UPI001653C6B8|nr:glycosyltransferase [Hymenobacter sp. BT491]MBC6990371.1 glycosyltransferase [Hymenobacter sp. BT491]
MEMPSLKVLLLGWDDTPKTQDRSHLATLPLAQALAAQTDLSLVLPHLPASGYSLPNGRVIGLGDLSMAELEALQLFPVRDTAGAWQSPSAPYVGSSASGSEDLAQASEASSVALLDLQNSDEFAQPAEPDAGEANDLSQPEDNITPDVIPNETDIPPATDTVASPLTSILTVAEHASAEEAVAILRSDLSDGSGLNFKVIQYARFATRLATNQSFGVIYAADWQSWLAALEIRQLTGRPLVLHVQSLALDRDSHDDRGWVLALERLALRRADVVLAATEEISQRLQNSYAVPAQRISVQPANISAENLGGVVQGILQRASAHNGI